MPKLRELSEEGGDGRNPKKQRTFAQVTKEEIDQVDNYEENGVEDGYGYEEEEEAAAVEDEQGAQKIVNFIDGEEDEGNEESKAQVYVTDLKVLDCSVCLRRLISPPFYLCENEHIACCSCCSSALNKCTICSPCTSFKRCWLLEKIIESLGESCVNRKYGCKKTVQCSMKDEHETYCIFVPCSCPIEGCDFLGPSMQLSTHLSSNHSDSLTRFRYNGMYSIALRFDERFCVLQEVDVGDVFLVNNVEHDIGNMISVCRIGPRTEISPFSIELEAKDWGHWDQLSLGLTCKNIESIRSRADHEPTSRDFLLVPNGFYEGDEFELLLRISVSAAQV